MYTYILIHWFVHFFIVHMITFLSKFSLIGYTIKIWIFDFPIYDYLIMYIATVLIDLDHLMVLKRFKLKAFLEFTKVRISYPFHNFFSLSILSLISLFLVVFNLRNIGIIFLAPISNLLWDMIEDILIFKVSYKKWKRIWGVDTKTLERLLNELKKEK